MLKGLFDVAAHVRHKTIKGINILGKHFGGDWIISRVLPKLNQAWEATDVSYLQRITVLKALLTSS